MTNEYQTIRDIQTVLKVEGLDLEIGSRKLLKEAISALQAAASINDMTRLDQKRYLYMIDCDFQAGRKYLPTLDENNYKAKLRAKHDAAIAAIAK